MKPLPDIIDYNLKILFVGFNPGIKSAETGFHYAGRGNSFWMLLADSGLTPFKLNPAEGWRLPGMGYGSVNIVDRPTRSAAEIRPHEYREGAVALKGVLELYRPKIACYLGIGVYCRFTGKTGIAAGLQQDEAVPGIADFVCTSPSGLNRTPYEEQLECFMELKRLKDAL